MTFGIVVAAVALCRPAAAVAPEPQTGYRGIVDRNIFGLKPPPEPAQPPNTAQQLPKILLTGITTILGNKLALLKLQPPPAKAGEQLKEEPLMLTEGQREGPVEVLQIDEKAGAVRVNNSGTVTTLTFEKDAPKIAPAPAMAAPNQAVPNTGLATLPASNALPNYANPAARTFRLPAPGTGAAAVQPGMNVAPATGTAAVAAPVSTVTPSLPSPVGQLTPEQQQLLRQIQEQVARESQNQPQTPAASAPQNPGAIMPGQLPVPQASGYVNPVRR